MIWFVIIVLMAGVARFRETCFGKITLGCLALIPGFLLLGWITDVALLFTLAKVCTILLISALSLATLFFIIR